MIRNVLTALVTLVLISGAVARAQDGVAVDSTGGIWFAETYYSGVAYVRAQSCSYRIGLPFQPQKVVQTDDGATWVEGIGNVVARIKLPDDIRYFELPHEANVYDIAVAGPDSIWVVPLLGKAMVRIGPAGISQRVPYADKPRVAGMVASGDGEVFVIFGSTLRTYADSGVTFTDRDLGFEPVAVAYSRGRLWLLTSQPAEIATLKGEVLQRIALPGSPQAFMEGNEISPYRDGAFVALHNILYKIDEDHVRIIATLSEGIHSVFALGPDSAAITPNSRYVSFVSPKGIQRVDALRSIEQSYFGCNASVLPQGKPNFHIFVPGSP